jgi:hypothetical protein
MVQGIMTRILRNRRGQSLPFLSVSVALLLALAMVTSAAFADMGSDPTGKDDAALLEDSSELCGCGSISYGANPSMDVALWYAGPDLSFLNASRALRADANPSMDVALWYAGPELSLLNASRALRADANPSMDVALWYAGPELSLLNASRALRADANPSMDVALWYAPAQVSTEDLLCLAEALSVSCQ